MDESGELVDFRRLVNVGFGSKADIKARFCLATAFGHQQK